MWKHVVLFGWIAAVAQAFAPAPIRWTGLPARNLVLAPRDISSKARVPFGADSPHQRLRIWDRPATASPNDIPYFTANNDKTIAWEGSCIEASGDTSGTSVRIGSCTGKPAQLWEFLPWGRGREIRIQLKGTNQCLDIRKQNEGSLNGASVELGECDQTGSWMFENPIDLPTRRSENLSVFSSSVRHVVPLIILMMTLGTLSLGAGLYRRQKAARALAKRPEGVLLNMDQESGVCLVESSAIHRGSAPLSPSMSMGVQSVVPAVMTLSASVSEELETPDVSDDGPVLVKHPAKLESLSPASSQQLRDLLDVDALIEELQRRLPRLLFATINEWLLTAELQSDADASTPIRVPLQVVRSSPVNHLLDVATNTGLDAYQLNKEGELVSTSANAFEFTMQSKDKGGADVTVVCNWHDALEFFTLMEKGRPYCLEAMLDERPLFEDPDFTEFRTIVGEKSFLDCFSGRAYLKACARAARKLVTSNMKEEALEGDIEGDFTSLVALCRRMTAIVETSCAGLIEELAATGSTEKARWFPVVEKLWSSASWAPTGALVLDHRKISEWVDRLREDEFSAFAAECVASGVEVDEELAGDTDWFLDDEFKERVGTNWPGRAELIFMTQTGSFMYNVSVASSDEDYTVIYMLPPEELCRREPPPCRIQQHGDAKAGSFGMDKAGEIQYSCTEIGTFVLDLAKGNHLYIELLFAKQPTEVSLIWRELREMRSMFLTCRCAVQYLGYIKFNMSRSRRLYHQSQEEGWTADVGMKISKLLYAAFKTIFEVERILAGEEPVVYLLGAERTWILALREYPPGSAAAAKAHVESVEKRYKELSRKFREVEQKGTLPREVDVSRLKEWLRSVRVRQMVALDQ